MSKRNRNQQPPKPTVPAHPKAPVTDHQQAAAEQLDARLRSGGPPAAPEPAVPGSEDKRPLEEILDGARRLDAPEKPVAPADAPGEDEDVGDFTEEAETPAETRREIDEEAPPQLDDAHTEDFAPLSDEEKANQADLLKKQQEAEAAGKVPPAGALVKPASKVVAPADYVMILNDNSGPMSMDLPTKLDHERSVSSGNTLTLLSGVNRVPRHDWERAKREKMIRIHMSEGNLVELGSRALGAMSAREAVKLVNLTVQKDLLLDWKETEKRTEVVKAINTVLERIAPSKKPKKGDDEFEDDEN